MRRSDLLLKLLSVAVAIGLLVFVRGQRRVTASVDVPVRAALPARLEAVELPGSLTVTVSGPWARLRGLDGDDLGPARLELSRAAPGPASWVARPDALRVPRGVRVESIYPAQGTVEIRRAPPPPPADPSR